MGGRLTRMGEIMETFVFLALLFAGFVYCRERRAPQIDPCTNYTVINDTFLDVSFATPIANLSSVMMMTWYRYQNYGQGKLAMSCPKGTQCGTTDPLWVDDTLPSVSDGIVLVEVCYKNATDCCSERGNVRVQNCGTFYVYFLNPQFPPKRWCFDNQSPATEKEGSKIGLIAGAAGGGVVAAGVAVGAIAVVRFKKMKVNTVDTSKPDSNSAENASGPEKAANGSN